MVATATELELTPGQRARAERDERVAAERRVRENRTVMEGTWNLIKSGLQEYADRMRREGLL